VRIDLFEIQQTLNIKKGRQRCGSDTPQVMVLTPLRVALAAVFAFAEGLLGLPPVDM